MEPVFGIMKSAPGHRRLMLRGLARESLGWDLVRPARDLKRLHRLYARPPASGLKRLGFFSFDLGLTARS